MKEGLDIEWTPGVETEPLPNLRVKSMGLAALVSFGLFCLLPFSTAIFTKSDTPSSIDTNGSTEKILFSK